MLCFSISAAEKPSSSFGCPEWFAQDAGQGKRGVSNTNGVETQAPEEGDFVQWDNKILGPANEL